MNLMSQIPDDLPQELFETILQTGQFRLERIVSRGHASADDVWYEQEQAEWVLLFQGEACLRYADGAEVTLRAGDHVLIPAGVRHQVAWTSAETDTVWLALHYSDS